MSELGKLVQVDLRNVWEHEARDFSSWLVRQENLDALGEQLGIEIAKRLVSQYPEQCVWGTDWPHPNHTHIPDDGFLVDALSRIAITPTLMEQVLVLNPQRLYRFVS